MTTRYLVNGQQGLMDMKGQEGRSGHLVVCVLDGHLMVTEVLRVHWRHGKVLTIACSKDTRG